MPVDPHAIEHSQCSFLSDGHPIGIEQFVPASDRPWPAVVALHGSGGLGGSFGDPGRLLAAQGFAVFIPHYFERTGTMWAEQDTIRREFPTWMKTIADTVSHVAGQAQVDAKRIGLLGFSLGAYLALSVAAQDRRIKAVAEYYGGLPEELMRSLSYMPPVLILHGEADAVVPISEAHRLRRALERVGSPFETKFYPGEGHVFSGEATVDAARRTVEFLRKYLACSG